MATPIGIAAARRQAATGYALRDLPLICGLTPLPGTSTRSDQFRASEVIFPGVGYQLRLVAIRNVGRPHERGNWLLEMGAKCELAGGGLY